jgi:ankyrin repeat protein
MPGAWIYSRIDVFAARFGYRDSLARVRKDFFGGNGMTRKIFSVTAIILSLALGAGAAHSATAIFEENEEVLAAQEASADEKPEPAPQKAPEQTPAPEPQKTPEPAPKKTPTAAKLSDEDFLALCKEGTPEEIKAAIENGANVNAKDKDGYTALMAAARHLKGAEVVSMLLDRGADVNAKDEDDVTALIYAVIDTLLDTEVISMLIERGADVNATYTDGRTVLMFVAPSYHVRHSEKVASMLIERGVDVNAVNNDGETALMMAVQRGRYSEKVISMLLERGADVNAKTKYGGYTVLMYAVSSFSTETVPLLIEHGADVNAVNNNGETALMIASGSQYNAETVSVLLEHGADVNAKSKNGNTALILAAWRSVEAVVSALLDAGAGIEAKNNEGMRAADYAANNPHLKNTAIYARLTEKSGDGSREKPYIIDSPVNMMNLVMSAVEGKDSTYLGKYFKFSLSPGDMKEMGQVMGTDSEDLDELSDLFEGKVFSLAELIDRLMGLAEAQATHGVHATKITGDLRTLKAASNLYYGDKSVWPAPGDEKHLDQYMDSPLVGMNPPRYKKIMVSTEVTDAKGNKHSYVGVTLAGEMATPGVKKRLVRRAVDSKLLGAVPGNGEEPKPYSGGDTVWMMVR